MSTKNIQEVLAEEAEAVEAGLDEPYPKAHRIRRRRSDDPAQVFSVRIPTSRMEELRKLAAEQHTTPGALIRRWVLDRLEGAR